VVWDRFSHLVPRVSSGGCFATRIVVLPQLIIYRWDGARCRIVGSTTPHKQARAQLRNLVELEGLGKKVPTCRRAGGEIGAAR